MSFLFAKRTAWKTSYDVGSLTFSTLAAAKKKAKEYANDEGRPIEVTIERRRFTGTRMYPEVKTRTVIVKPNKNRANPAPSPSALRGATILSVKRNAKGAVTALRLRLRPTNGGGKRGNPTKTKPAYYVYEKGNSGVPESRLYAKKRDAQAALRATKQYAWKKHWVVGSKRVSLDTPLVSVY